MSMQKIAIIGSGFSSLSAACYLSKAGNQVTVYEKNDQLGGRARILKHDGFTFDMGPSWYWMPDVFENFFSDFNKKPSDYYDLLKLSPAYKVFFNDYKDIEIPSSFEEIVEIFEKEEVGSGEKLKDFMADAGFNYKVAIEKIVNKPGFSPLELITPETVSKINHFFTNISSKIRKTFKSQKLVQILEFPVLFLGAKPQDTPLFYNFMNYADFVLGTWYPKGGMVQVVEAMVSLGKELGVKYVINANVSKINVESKVVKGITVDNEFISSDFVLSGADYAHTETLLENKSRQYSEAYWDKKIFAPSSLLFYIGFDKKLNNVRHHNLFFDKSFDNHAAEIYDNPKWPKEPLFYASFPSITDDSVAPQGKECGFFLVPLAPGLEYNKDLPNKYFKVLIKRLEEQTNQKLEDNVLFKIPFCVEDFKKDYNSYKGNAYGMANTLLQTAFLRPSIKSKKVKNLFFTGQLTVPGPGVPPALISGKIVSKQIIKQILKTPVS
jgi:phytoene desaturase